MTGGTNGDDFAAHFRAFWEFVNGLYLHEALLEAIRSFTVHHPASTGHLFVGLWFRQRIYRIHRTVGAFFLPSNLGFISAGPTWSNCRFVLIHWGRLIFELQNHPPAHSVLPIRRTLQTASGLLPVDRLNLVASLLEYPKQVKQLSKNLMIGLVILVLEFCHHPAHSTGTRPEPGFGSTEMVQQLLKQHCISSKYICPILVPSFGSSSTDEC